MGRRRAHRHPGRRFSYEEALGPSLRPDTVSIVRPHRSRYITASILNGTEHLEAAYAALVKAHPTKTVRRPEAWAAVILDNDEIRTARQYAASAQHHFKDAVGDVIDNIFTKYSLRGTGDVPLQLDRLISHSGPTYGYFFTLRNGWDGGQDRPLHTLRGRIRRSLTEAAGIPPNESNQISALGMLAIHSTYVPVAYIMDGMRGRDGLTLEPGLASVRGADITAGRAQMYYQPPSPNPFAPLVSGA